MNREVLGRPFPPHAVRTKPGPHGKTVRYVDVAAVIARLNEGCDAWSFEVVSHKVDADEVIVLGKLTADDQTKMHFGGSAVTLNQEGRAVSLADDLKAAASGSGSAPARPRERAPEPNDRVTARQLAAIQAVCRRRSLGRDALHALVSQKTGKSAVQFLTKAEASAVLDALGRENGVSAH